jgi:hypothetical protein
MRHRIRGTNDWGWQGVGPTLFLWRMIFWCATEMTYFCGAPGLVRHRNYFCGALVAGAPQNCIPSIRAFLLVYGPIVQGRLLTHRAGGKHGDEEDLQWRFPSPAGCREELLDPPDLRVDGGGGSRCVLKKVTGFRFSRRGVFIGEEVASEVDQGAHTIGRRGPGVGRTPWCCGHPLVWLRLSFDVLEAPVNI